jgi:hypothetical protein
MAPSTPSLKLSLGVTERDNSSWAPNPVTSLIEALNLRSCASDILEAFLIPNSFKSSEGKKKLPPISP